MKNLLLTVLFSAVLHTEAMPSKEKLREDKIPVNLFTVCVQPPFQVLQIQSKNKVKIEELSGSSVKINQLKFKEWTLRKPLYINYEMPKDSIIEALCKSLNTDTDHVTAHSLHMSQNDFQELFPNFLYSTKTWLQGLYQKITEKFTFLDDY